MGQKLKNSELQRHSTEEFKLAKKQEIAIVLDNVRSLNNVGSAFRTADAFLINEILLCGVTGTPPNKEIEKTALGATSTVDWRHFRHTKDAIESLRQAKYKIYSVEQVKNSTALPKFKKGKQKIALVFGNEVYGVEQEIIDLSDGVIEIPQLGTKHSLNISVSIGVVLWEMSREQF